MRNLLTGSILVVVVVVFSAVVFAQTAPQSGTAQGRPDLSGFWEQSNEASGHPSYAPFTLEDVPMQPWAAEMFKFVQEGMQNIRPQRQGFDRGKEAYDPTHYPSCLPHGFPRVFANPNPFEILQVPGQVLIFFESNRQTRRIHTDGRTIPEEYPLSFMGYSVGRWDGDTLVVETAALNDLSWLDGMGHPHTDELRVLERIRRVDRDTLQIDFVFDDPKTYTRPWMGKKVFKLNPDLEVMETILCEHPQSQEHLRKLLPGKRQYRLMGR